MLSPAETSPWRLEWSDDLSVYIPELDAEHKHFIQLINEFNEAITQQMDIAEIEKRMQAILDDAGAHFYHEETLFRQWGYPDTEAHAQKHAKILIELSRIMGETVSGVEYVCIEVGLKLKKILIGHLLSEDMKYRDYYQQRLLPKE